MTQNQMNQLAKSPNTKKAIQVLEKFAKMETQYKELEKEHKAAIELIKEAMIDQGIEKIDIDTPKLTGYITLVEKTLYKAEELDQVSKKYLKVALDSTKVKAQHTLTGELPVGVEEKKSVYITKKLKEV